MEFRDNLESGTLAQCKFRNERYFVLGIGAARILEVQVVGVKYAKSIFKIGFWSHGAKMQTAFLKHLLFSLVLAYVPLINFQ